MTVLDLYAESETFRAGIAKWLSDRACPLELGDFLEERGYPLAAECARCVYESPEAVEYFSPPGHLEVFMVRAHDARGVEGINMIGTSLVSRGRNALGLLALLDDWTEHDTRSHKSGGWAALKKTRLIAGAPIRPGQLLTTDENGRAVPYPTGNSSASEAV